MADGTPAAVESPAEFGADGPGIYKRWEAEVNLAKAEFERYHNRCRKIERRFRGDLEVVNNGTDRDVALGLQILWSTVQTQIPAVYQFPPNVEVSRRFRTKDPSARVASLILERYLDVECDRDDFDAQTLAALQDRLLFSLGQMWVEYEPVIETVPTPVTVIANAEGGYVTGAGTPYTGEAPTMAPDGSMVGAQPYEKIVDCRAPAVHLSIDDFLHSPARKWSEVRWVARRQYFTRDECVEKFAQGMQAFGWQANDIPLNFRAKQDGDDAEKTGNLFKRAEVWQIWSDKDVVYICPGMAVPLQSAPRPLALKSSKWPCPRPYYGTTTSKTLIPVPDFTQWQELADEIDELTVRIEQLTKCVRMTGARPADQPELDKIIQGGAEAQLIAVENWAMFKGEKGGLENMISWMPMDQVMAVLVQLQQQRKERIDYAYQINGVGDILRGQGDPRSTATAEKIKENYGSLRLRQMQQDLGAFIERVLQIKAEIICEKAPPEILVEVSGISEIQQDQQFIGPALQMLKDQRVRDLRIDVDEESMVAMQDENQKQARMEFVNAMTPMIGQVVQAAQQMPGVLDVAGETMLFAARGFRVGRDMEGTLEQFVDATRAIAQKSREDAQNKPPPPSPEEIKAQAARELEAQKNANKLQQIDAQTAAERDQESSQARSEAAIESVRAESKQAIAANEAQWQMRLLEVENRFAKELEVLKANLAARNDHSIERVRAANRPPKPPRGPAPNGGGFPQ